MRYCALEMIKLILFLTVWKCDGGIFVFELHDYSVGTYFRIHLVISVVGGASCEELSYVRWCGYFTTVV